MRYVRYLLIFFLISFGKPLLLDAQLFGGQIKSGKIGAVSTLDCAGATLTGTLVPAQVATGVSVSIPYTGGNGGAYGAQSVASTGVTGLTAAINVGQFANGAGSLVYSITGTPASSGTASFAVTIGGQSCTLNLTVAYPTNWWIIGNGLFGISTSSTMLVRYQDVNGVYRDVTLEPLTYNGYIMVQGTASFTPVRVSGSSGTTFDVQNLGAYNSTGCYTKLFYLQNTCSTCSPKTFSYIDCSGVARTVTLTPASSMMTVSFRQLTSCEGRITIE